MTCIIQRNECNVREREKYCIAMIATLFDQVDRYIYN